MKKISCILLITAMLPFVASCTTKQSTGTAIGALAGGAIGAHFGKGGGKLLATGIGMMAGAVIGSEIGKQLDDYDRRLMQNTSQQALEFSPSGQEVAWKNPDSGHYGSITPVRTIRRSDNSYCREYQQKIVIGGREEKAYGTACRQPDGQWQIVK